MTTIKLLIQDAFHAEWRATRPGDPQNLVLHFTKGKARKNAQINHRAGQYRATRFEPNRYSA